MQSVFHLENVSSTLLRNNRAFRHITEDSNLHIYPCDDLKPTKLLTDLTTNQSTRMRSTFFTWSTQICWQTNALCSHQSATCFGPHTLQQFVTYTVELHLSGLIGKARYPDMQKIWINGFFFEKNATLEV